jgi:hypothetical protein
MENQLLEPLPEQVTLDRLREALDGLMDITSVRVLSAGTEPTVEFGGIVRGDDVDVTFDEILARFELLATRPVLTRPEEEYLMQLSLWLSISAPQTLGECAALCHTALSVLLIGA